MMTSLLFEIHLFLSLLVDVAPIKADDFDFLDDVTWTKLQDLAALDATSRHNIVSYAIQLRHRELVSCGRIGQDGKRRDNRAPGGAAKVRW